VNEDLEKLLKDNALSDAVKTALIPALINNTTSPRSGWQKWLSSAPIVAAMASVLTLSLSEGVKVYLAGEEALETRSLAELTQEHVQWLDAAKRDFETHLATLDREHERNLETLKFKDAGFAWRGDAGIDAMSFAISKTVLAQIKASGYVPELPQDQC
jgi:hypothetical protein